ncbi:protein NRT1/ PTR FAMILY 5.10-like isoform X2 [Iris pallida]|uniref:Protein NRT1/ PTR FAMILY 5.10-like isoform X2 n=1 Tax=Iris pallida TaxID=29817 RepID=A0AAX6HGW0_IRIPA|nr:protein NRT1/ PTR FAMILY 5.10-like isoform X2 [Iris pallida]
MDSDPFLPRQPDHLSGVVDYKGRPIRRQGTGTGGWTSALFIIGVETAERSAYYGISLNLITYLTGHLGQSTAAAAAGVNTWSGVAQMMPLLGAFVADSYLGRYRTITIASLLYVLGLGLLTLSSIMQSLRPHVQVALFYFSLYLVAFAQGGHKPCVQAFGADQFDENDPQERISRSSFFNWWYFGVNVGITASLVILSYVQDNVSWGLGFGIPCVLMFMATIVFLMGTKTYRYYPLEEESPFARIGRSFVALARNRGAHSDSSDESHFLLEGAERETWSPHARDQSKLEEDGSDLRIGQLEEARGVLRLFPIWATCLIFAIVFAQSATFFTKQGGTMYRRIGSSFEIPPASLQSLIGITIVTFMPIYDRILVPIARSFSKRPSGFTILQRVGIGIAFSMVSMVVAALVETKRLKIARESGLIDQPNATVPMSLWWLVPQYVLYGLADSFAMVGLQEFFYDQVPDALRSLGLALYLSIFGIGSFISSFLVSVINEVTRRTGESWFSNNLNHAHLDYFYWLLAGLSAVGLIIYLFFARAYVYKKKVSSAL